MILAVVLPVRLSCLESIDDETFETPCGTIRYGTRSVTPLLLPPTGVNTT